MLKKKFRLRKKLLLRCAIGCKKVLVNYLLITARYSSTRLPGKMLLKLGDHSILGHSISRAKSAGFTPVLCTSTDYSDDALVEEALKYKVQSFRGSLLNKIQRWCDCAKSFGFDDVHIVDGDDPYFDPHEILQSLQILRTHDLNLVRTSVRSDSGFATVGMSVKFSFLVELASRASQLQSSDFDVIPWNLLLHSEDKVSVAPNSFLTSNHSVQLRLTLDYPEDLTLMNIIAKNFSFDASRTEIEKFLVQNEEILQVNELRTNDFLTNKKVQLRHNFRIES